MPIRGASSQPMLGVDLDQNDDNSNNNSSNGGGRHESFSFRRTLSSTFSSFVTPSSPSTTATTSSSTSPRSSRRRLLRTKSSLRQSLRRLDSSHRLSITCSGSDLSQLYLSSPEQDAYQLLSQSQSQSKQSSSSSIVDFDDVGGGATNRSRSNSSGEANSWLQNNVDLYGRRRSFRRMNSYARFLDMDVMSEIAESSDGDDDVETKMVLIEETTDRLLSDDVQQVLKTKRKRLTCSCLQKMKSPAIVVPTMMIIDLILGVSLSLYDSNLLRNVPGFNFPLCYALTQKLTNACASLVLICLSRKWEMDERARQVTKRRGIASVDDTPLLELPSIATFRRHMIPLSAVALVQTVSAAFANQALQIIPLPLFKVCLMCGPIFVALCSILAEGQMYSKGRMLALSLIGMGAFRAVYAEAEGADNPRFIMEGAGYALGASAFSGIGLVLSSVLMHREEEEEEELGEKDFLLPDGDNNLQKKVEVAKIEEVELNPLSLLFYLSCKQVLMLSVCLCPWDLLFGGENNEAVEESQEPSEFAAFTIYFVENPQTAIFYLMTGSMMSLCLAVLTFILVNRTSPVAISLLGNGRSILTVAISTTVFGNGGGGGGLFGSAAFGYTLTLAGGVAYAFAALRNNAPSSK